MSVVDAVMTITTLLQCSTAQLSAVRQFLVADHSITI